MTERLMSDMELKVFRMILEERGLLRDGDVREYVLEILGHARELFDHHDSVGCVAAGAKAAAIAIVGGIDQEDVLALFTTDSTDSEGASIYKMETLEDIIRNVRMYCAVLMDSSDVDGEVQIMVRGHIVEESNFLELTYEHSKGYIDTLTAAAERLSIVTGELKVAATEMQSVHERIMEAARDLPVGVPEPLEKSDLHIKTIWEKGDFTALIAIYITNALIAVNLGFAHYRMLDEIIEIASRMAERVGGLLRDENDEPVSVREKELRLFARRGPRAFVAEWLNPAIYVGDDRRKDNDGDKDDKEG